MNSLVKLVALSLIPGIGGVTLNNLLARFGDIDAVLEADTDQLLAVKGVGKRTAAAIRAADPAQTASDLQRWREAGITLLTWSNLLYPEILVELSDAPPVLFCKGTLLTTDHRAVGVVGTRRPSPSARNFAETLGRELAKRSWTIVSGLAWGIDLAAHSGALETGRTVAILGSGVLQLPPKKHAIVRQILANGALLSETHPHQPPSAASLVARNRLISGMSRAVIVVESGKDSGSLYTARFARKQDRPIFAVDNGSEGNTILLENGATPLARLSRLGWSG